MSHCRRAVLIFLLVLAALESVEAVRCRLYHRIWEDGHLLRINPDVCHSSAKYCVRASYSDPDQRKKNGFSMGCDKVDCVGIDNPKYTGWKRKANGEVCRKSRDYGKKGEICCCASDMCNSSTIPASFLTFVLSVTFYFLWC